MDGEDGVIEGRLGAGEGRGGREGTGNIGNIITVLLENELNAVVLGRISRKRKHVERVNRLTVESRRKRIILPPLHLLTLDSGRYYLSACMTF